MTKFELKKFQELIKKENQHLNIHIRLVISSDLNKTETI